MLSLCVYYDLYGLTASNRCALFQQSYALLKFVYDIGFQVEAIIPKMYYHKVSFLLYFPNWIKHSANDYRYFDQPFDKVHIRLI